MAITKFRHEFFFLSNFYPVLIVYGGVVFPSVEHAYVAAKTVEAHQYHLIANLATASEAKRYGRTLRLRQDWPLVKLEIMKHFLVMKFTRPDLKKRLLRTKPHELIEENTWGDTFWGKFRGEGENHLGRLLMEVRASL